jgi:hypothetical protein
MCGMLFTFITACLTYSGTKIQDLTGELRISCQHFSGENTCVSTIVVQSDTPDHLLHILLIKTSISTMDAVDGTLIQRINQATELFMTHS